MAKKIIVTHDSKFHADDVFAVAALLLHLKGDAEVLRSREPSVIAGADFVVDVGGVYDAEQNRFDHHQIGGAGVRKSSLPAQAGIPYAAFGLVWKKFGEKISGNREAAELIDSFLVAPTDAEDNGVVIFTPRDKNPYPYEAADAIHAFVPTWKEENISLDERFMEAVSFAMKIIEYEVAGARADIEGKAIVEKAYRDSNDKRLIVLEDDYPWEGTLARFPEPLFAIHPRNGMWYLECVRDEPQAFANRKELPKLWAGLRDAELAEATGVLDAIFCHNGKFMAVAKSKEGALALASLALAIRD